MTPGLCSLKGPARGRELEPPSRSRTLAAGTGGASQSEPSQPGTEGESGGSDLPPEWLLPDVA